MRAFVSLGELSPDDVDVQLVHGRSTPRTSCATPSSDTLALAETYEGGRYRFDGTVALDRSGAFGYTVRVVPAQRPPRLRAELGLVALPA